MAIINSIIPPSNFELIRNRISQILAEEFANQYAITTPVNDDINPAVSIERFIPFDCSEMPAINVCLSGGNYDNKDITQVDGTYSFNIDCYASAETTSQSSGDVLATIKLHRLMAMARAILENPGYNTLGYAKPFSCSVKVASINIADPVRNDESTHQIQGRIEFIVKVPEYISLKTAVPITGNDTIVKLYLTDKGYQWGMAGQTGFFIPEVNPDPVQVSYFIME